MDGQTVRSESKPVRVFIADDHAMVRAGLSALLRDTKNVEIVGEAGDGPESLRLIKELKPEVVILDISMPGLNGLDVLERLHASTPGIAVIILSMHADERYVRWALRAGARGYLLKNDTAAELPAAVQAAMTGEVYLSAAVRKTVVEVYTQGKQNERSGLDLLTTRQREILQLLAEGQTPKSIAHTLGLSVKTVHAHRTHLMERLGLVEASGIVKFAIRMGLVRADT